MKILSKAMKEFQQTGRSGLTFAELNPHPTKIDKMRKRILKMLEGWSVEEIDTLWASIYLKIRINSFLKIVKGSNP